ncbi:OmpA family protein [Tenacibaculum sp. 1B UA]|uniref:OmpA family protein n=1 Tax=Tenacibaculum sp. 1B UA TaxID=2922252 RepID=UPI002A2476E8|nr:OmpA family protein [Tenacibaculum sp. 1B UA]MDX8553961.1 OmpA family protein [Tenacibaculum sp. 1B UA]
MYFINRTRQSKLLVLLLISVVFQSYSQKKTIEKANKAFTSKAYVEAAIIYEKVFNKGYKSESLLQNLGDSYYFNGKYKDAVKWYAKLFNLNKHQLAIYELRYAQALKASGKALLGKEYYEQYLSKIGVKESPVRTTDKYLELIKANSRRYRINKVPFNSDGIDFGLSRYGKDKFVFASTRNTRNKVSTWDGLPYLDLYEVKISNNSVGTPSLLKGKINNKYHESTASFTKDGNTMYFTRTSPKVSNKSSELRLKIFKATLYKGEWGNIEELSINEDGFNTAHPVLNIQENKLYFVSDRPGGEGATDIYYTEVKEDGSLGEVKNLGKKVNTPGRESFPFISENNELYFSSDGHFGLGGYDVFFIKMNTLGEPSGELLNVGSPINSSFDDICYIVYKGKGFISSNRSEKGQGYDNIYSFIEKKPLREVSVKSRMHGIVTDKESAFPLRGTVIKIFNTDNILLHTLRTNQDGKYNIEVAYKPAYILNVMKEGYKATDGFSKELQEDRKHNFQLSPENTKLLSGTDLAKTLNVPPVYFDYGQWNIRASAEVELQKIVETMKQYPKLKVEIRSHTDSRSNDDFNMSLSRKRSESTKKYLLYHGVSKDRITAKGYGETQLLNKCSNNVPCSEKEHQINRRSEFIIVN